jgi:outer membrane autotransporter protein
VIVEAKIINDAITARASKYARVMGFAISFGLLSFLPLPEAQAQVATRCTNPVGTFIFNPDWGPAAVCAAASAGTSITSAITTLDIAFLTQSTAFVSSPSNPRPDQLGGGIWVRGIGGQNTVSSSGATTGIGSVGGGTLAINSQERTEYGGFQAGADLGKFNLGASNLNVVFGITGGLLDARATEQIGVGSTQFSVPFFGGYVAVTKDRFFADAEVRGDFYNMTANNSNVGLSNTGFNGRGITVTGSAGYSIPVGTFFVEPSAAIVWSRLSVDNLSTPGTGAAGFGVPAGTYSFGTPESLIGRLGLRLGTTFQSPTISWQPFVSASVWDEFAAPNTTTFACTVGEACPLSLSTVTSRIGVFGQLGIGTSAEIVNTGVLGYLRADYRAGDNIRGWDITGGIRYQFPVGTPSSAR